MGAIQSEHTKNTFIDVDTRSLDNDFITDTRRVKSWHSFPLTSGFEVLLQEEAVQPETLPDDSMLTQICRVKTLDRFDPDVDSEDSDWSQESDQPWEAIVDHVQRSKAFTSQSTPLNNVSYETSQLCAIPQQVSPSITFSAPPTATPSLGPVMANPSDSIAKLGGNTEFSNQSEFKLASALAPSLPYKSAAPTWSVKDKSAAWTCRMVRNIPNDYTRQDLIELLDSKQIDYNFVYLPIDWHKRANLGYAFINLATSEEAHRLKTCLCGFSEWKVSSEKVCDVVWGKEDQQELHLNVERFRNSPVMHPDVPEEFKPLLFINGRRVAFPAPTRDIRPPRNFCYY